ncbi:MAG: hypothetical protein RR505_14935, partial [Raoultibacter sp.]
LCPSPTATEVHEMICETPYRVVHRDENAERKIREICANEGIAELCIVRGGECVIAPSRKRSFPRRVASRCKRIVWEMLDPVSRSVSISSLLCVDKAERKALQDTCARANRHPKRILVVSQMAAFDRCSCAYWKILQRQLKDVGIMHLSETPRLSDATLCEKLNGEWHRARWAAFPSGFPRRTYGTVAQVRKDHASPAVRAAAQNLSLRFPTLGQEGAWALSLYLQELFALALDTFQRQIPAMYMEFGLLPGTMSFDWRGQMGQSALAHEPLLPMPQDALDEAAHVIAYLNQRQLNRNAQHVDDDTSRICLPKHDCRVITLIGQNDYESGICPYDETARREHSPWYASTADALKELAEVCRARGDTLVFRPHPAMHDRPNEIPQSVLYCRGGNLFSLLEQSDLVVTLMSQVGYEALLHHRNVLMLGRCQLSGKGCAWERRPQEALRAAIERALDGGYTQEMQEHFRCHIAHVIRDYAFDDMTARELRYGQTPEQWLRLLNTVWSDE